MYGQCNTRVFYTDKDAKSETTLNMGALSLSGGFDYVSAL